LFRFGATIKACVGLCLSMAHFDLKQFLGYPYLDELDSCCKDDLGQIAAHLSVSYPKQLFKKELIVRKLVE